MYFIDFFWWWVPGRIVMNNCRWTYTPLCSISLFIYNDFSRFLFMIHGAPFLCQPTCFFCCLFALSIFSNPNGSFFSMILPNKTFYSSYFCLTYFARKINPTHPSNAPNTTKKNIRKIILLFHHIFFFRFIFPVFYSCRSIIAF